AAARLRPAPPRAGPARPGRRPETDPAAYRRTRAGLRTRAPRPRQGHRRHAPGGRGPWRRRYRDVMASCPGPLTGPDRHDRPTRSRPGERLGVMAEIPEFTTRPELAGTFGMVASTHWLASAAGL